MSGTCYLMREAYDRPAPAEVVCGLVDEAQAEAEDLRGKVAWLADALARVEAAAVAQEARAAEWERRRQESRDLAGRDLMMRIADRHRHAARVIRAALAEPVEEVVPGGE